MDGFGKRSKSWSAEFTPVETTNREYSRKAISLGFAATAILICMFLIMAIFEHIIRQKALALRSRSVQALEPSQPHIQISSFGKLGHLPTVGTPYLSDCLVLMPGSYKPCPSCSSPLSKRRDKLASP